ncbi:putative quinol monooxygenase [Nocardia sp. NBC_00511]|uniref:putative quinol monooxygenase n=1 Tax=Nocardia sp. NBC_00511 TaxID=2903591 RepID=UPI0030E3DA1F
MSLHVVAELRAAAGHEDRLRTALESMIEPSLSEPGCRSCQPFSNPNEPGHMVVVEEWDGPDALENHFATDHFRHIAGVLESIVAEPIVIRRLVAE